MNTDKEHDELWHLLGRAKEPQVSPFFSRNILRAIREEQPEPLGFVTWLRRRWKLAVLTTGGAVLVLVALVPKPITEQPDSLLLAAHEVSASPDYQVISNLDELLDSERNSVWLEASAY